MGQILEDYVEFKIKKFKKLDKNIICLTYLKETLTINDDLLKLFIKKYVKVITENPESFLIIEARNIKNIDFNNILDKIDVFKKLDKIVEKYIYCIVYLINNTIFKNMGNTIIKMYPPVVPVRICDENKEAIKFFENVYTKNK